MAQSHSNSRVKSQCWVTENKTSNNSGVSGDHEELESVDQNNKRRHADFKEPLRVLLIKEGQLRTVRATGLSIREKRWCHRHQQVEGGTA